MHGLSALFFHIHLRFLCPVTSLDDHIGHMPKAHWRFFSLFLVILLLSKPDLPQSCSPLSLSLSHTHTHTHTHTHAHTLTHTHTHAHAHTHTHTHTHTHACTETRTHPSTHIFSCAGISRSTQNKPIVNHPTTLRRQSTFVTLTPRFPKPFKHQTVPQAIAYLLHKCRGCPTRRRPAGCCRRR